MRPVRMVLCAAAIVLLSAPAFATTLIANFATLDPADPTKNGTNLGSPTVTLNSITADGFDVTRATSGTPLPTFNNDQTQTGLTLYARDIPNSEDHGLGICSPGETTGCASGQGGGNGDINEVDNLGKQEFLRLTRPDLFQWEAVTISSIDLNTAGSQPERGLLFGNNTGNISDALVNLLQFEGGASAFLTFNTFGANAGLKYLFFVPYDWKNGTNFNNDFLVNAAVVNNNLGTPDGRSFNGVPEPASLTLLGLGLSAGGVLRRRLRKR